MLKNNLYYIYEKLYFNVARIQYSIIFCNMGIQCSKQGSHPFDDYLETRVSPEGEYDPLKFSSCLPSEEKKSNHLNLKDFKCNGSLKDIRSSKESKWSSMVDETTFVDLPPVSSLEDKEVYEETTSNNQQFQYHAPNVKHLKDSSDYESFTNDSYSSSTLSNSERESRSSRDSQGSMCSMQFKESEITESGQIDRWTYTLYDFQGKGIVSKKDFRHLIETVYNTVKHDSKHKDSFGHSLKIHVEIKRQCTSKNEKSSKYTSSKVCKGMIFPPPNTEEAEKISNYIEKRLYRHNTTNRTEHNCLRKKCSYCNVKNNSLFYCKHNYSQPSEKNFNSSVKNKSHEVLKDFFDGIKNASKLENSKCVEEISIKDSDIISPSLSKLNMQKCQQSLTSTDNNSSCCLCEHSSICCVREHSSSCCVCKHSLSCRFRRHSSSCRLGKKKLKDSTVINQTFTDKNNLHQFRIKHLCTSHKNFIEQKPTLSPFFDTTKNSDFTVNTKRKSSLRKDRQKVPSKSSDGSEKNFKDLCSSHSSSENLKHSHSSFSRPPVWPGECVAPVDWTSIWPRECNFDKKKTDNKYFLKNDKFCECKRLSNVSYSYRQNDYTSCVSNSVCHFPSFIPAL
ncbi:uncharacterized protein LOC100205238 [Hydra vulgaris]|uniref:uncharacterized protein LOC100205238 n=1 Tax=Hydra vulgaris TaxID=6087 RepID=UPI001F5E93A1|nr:uncharacterized protein LOC100205238 [Hydra vulgaris]